MAVEEVLSGAPEIILELGKIGNWIQAVGLIVIAWIIIQAITFYFNFKRLKTLSKFESDIERIEKKINSLARKIR